MGNRTSLNKKQEVISNVAVNNPHSQIKVYSNFLYYSQLAQVFKSHSPDGNCINEDKFNRCIADLLKFDLPLLPYTYLSERLFYLMDKNMTGIIYEKDFLNEMSLVFSGQDYRQECILNLILVFYHAMMNNKKKQYLEFTDIVDYLQNCWLYAFRFVDNYVKSKYLDEFENKKIFYPIETYIFEEIVLKNTDSIKEYTKSTLVYCGIKDLSIKLDYESLKKWLAMDHTLEICYHDKRFRFAVNLICLNEIGLTK